MDIAQLGLEIRSDGVVVATDRLGKFEKQAARSSNAVDLLVKAAASLAAALSVRAIIRYADAWSDMQSRVGAAIKDMAAAPAMMQRMVDLANASYSPLEQTVEIYARNVAVLKDLGINAAGAADFTESLNHMLVITATRGERAASVQNALSKAMAVGKLQAEGLETVLANGGRVAEALAAELGTTVSGLRKMASEGKITGAVIANALLGSLEDVRVEAGKMPPTIADAFVRIQNNTTALIGTLDKAWGISASVSEAMLGMADNIRGSADTLLRLGNVAGTLVGPALDLLASNAEAVGQAAVIAVAALAGFYTPAVLGGIAALTVAIGTGLVGAIRAVTLAMMANPIGVLVGALAAGVAAAFMFRDEIKQAIGIDVVEVMVDVGNKTIGVFVGAYEAIKDQWSNLPVFFSAIGKMAWNSFVESFEGPALTIDTPWGSWQSGGLDLSGVKAQLSDAEKASFGQSTVAFDDAFNRDYIGGLTTAVGELWTNAEGATGAMAGLMDAAGGGGTATDAGSGTGKKNPYADLIRGANEFIAAQHLEAQAIGMTAQAANALRYEQEMLNEAANDNIALTAAQKEQIAGLAASMASAEQRTNSLKAAYDFAKGTFTGFFDDMRGGLKDGMSWWEAFAGAATNALNKVIDKAFEMLASGIFDMILGASGGGWISAIAGLFGFAKGGVFENGGLQAFAQGGVVSRPTVFPMARGAGLMGEVGPEAIMPLRRGRDGKLGVVAQNDNRAGGVVEVRVSLDDDMLNVRIDNRAAGVSAQVVQGGLTAYDATAPARSAEQQARFG